MADRSGPQLLAGTLVGAGLLVATLLPVPYVVLRPGPVFDTLGSVGDQPVISISGAPTYPTSGRLDLTTVSESGGPRSRISVIDALRGWFDPDVAVVPTRLLYAPDTTPDQVEEEGAVEMVDSQDAAEVAALRQVGLPVTPTVEIAEVSADGASAGKIEVGDRVVSVDGVEVSTPEQVSEGVTTHRPGEQVRVGYVRKGVPGEVVVTTKASDSDPAKPRIGVVLRVGYTSPVTIDITLDDVGGPSAGLMFSLGIVDQLTPGALTGGRHVAGTGTIDADGEVGPIGGIHQKMAGARDAGASVFLVPQGNCSEARTDPPEGLRLVAVKTLDAAVEALEAIDSGQGAVPTC